MRFVFTDTGRPADAARDLQSALRAKGIETTYTACQETVARGCGWLDWRELKSAAGRLAASPLAEPGSPEAEDRVASLAAAVADLGLNREASMKIARDLGLTVTRRAVAPGPDAANFTVLTFRPAGTGVPAPKSPQEMILALPDFARSVGVELADDIKGGLEAMAAELERLKTAAVTQGIDWDSVVAKAYAEAAERAKPPKLSLLPKVPPEDVALWVMEWLETERGWGQRPDGHSVHASPSDYRKYLADYWAKMPNEVPDEYSRPCWDQPVRVVVPAGHPLAVSLAVAPVRSWHHSEEDRAIRKELDRTASEQTTQPYGRR